MPGAEPFSSDAGPVGVLLCHGFTGCPQSMRPWAEHLAAAGMTVRLPRLPGHGTTWRELDMTRWQDWYAELDRTLTELHARCAEVFVMGLSMGATLGLRLAQERGDDVSGLALVNPSLLTKRPERHVAPVLQYVIRSLPAIASDIKKPGVTELAYDRVPSKAAYSLTKLWAATRGDLGKVTQPVLVFRSRTDNVVEPDSCALLHEKVRSTDIHEVVLEDSYHVATLDNDAQTIFDGSLEFVRRLARTKT